jgi:hypothetical protein
MIARIPPWGLIVIGFVLSLTGVVLPFLIVIHVLPSTFFLNFFSYGASMLGLFLGIIGVSFYVRQNRK